MKWRSFKLGDSTVWLDRHLVVRGDRHIKLQPKVIEVLTHLVAAAGDTVSRESIKSKIWENSESDDLLSNAIWKLRKALGDNGDLIETIPRYGYRLTQAPSPLKTDRALAGRRRSYALGGVIALVVIVAGLFRFSTDKPGEPARISPLPLLRLTGIESGPSYSNDGRRVAFVSAYDSYHTDLFIYDRVSGESQQITSDAAWNYHPAFSPDGQLLAVFRYLDGHCQIEVFRVSSKQQLSSLDCSKVDGRSLGWSPDSTRLVVAIRNQSETGPVLLDPLTGESAAIHFDGQAVLSGVAPSLAHSTKQLAVIANAAEGQQIKIHGEAVAESPVYPHIYALTWARDDDALFFTTYVSPDLTQLWRWHWRRSAPQAWIVLPGRNTQLSTSPDGRELAYDATRGTADLWQLTPAEPQLRRVAMTAMNEAQPVINRQGDQVAFLADEPRPGTVWIRDLHQGTSRYLGFPDLPVLEVSWLESTQLVGTVRSQAGLDVVRLDLESESVHPVFSDGGDRSMARSVPSDSPSSLYFLGQGQTVNRYDVESNSTRTLPLKEVRDFRPSPDHRWIYFTQRHAPGLWRLHLEDHHVESVAPDLDRSDWGNFAVTSAGYVYVRRHSGNALLVWRDHNHSTERILASHKGMAQGASLTISGDGTIVARVQARYEGDIMKLAISF